ncbi:MAG: hypothetical protein JRG96_02385 [Deltaproteobacteria bacterium]|nr:hypothetical protein [Deltaproteobacteria bacterium]MBW2418403.1 hypothetical protein [Deltaproteobacteria bacterium]
MRSGAVWRAGAARGLAGLALLTSLGALACADSQPARDVRQYTYSPDFRYISQEELQSAMWQLAAEVAQLDRLLLAEQDPELMPPPPEKLDAVLGRIEGKARRLHSGARSSNHPLLNDHLDRFMKTVKRARLDLQRDPPQYAASGAVAGACAQCHEMH